MAVPSAASLLSAVGERPSGLDQPNKVSASQGTSRRARQASWFRSARFYLERDPPSPASKQQQSHLRGSWS